MDKVSTGTGGKLNVSPSSEEVELDEDEDELPLLLEPLRLSDFAYLSFSHLIAVLTSYCYVSTTASIIVSSLWVKLLVIDLSSEFGGFL